MDKNECIKCKKKGSLRDKLVVFPCDSCSCYYCGDCAELSASEIKCMQLIKQRTLKFFCSQCVDNELNDCLKNTIKDKENIINDKVTIIKMLQEKIQLLEVAPISYANAVTSNNQYITDQSKKNVPAIIIQPINPQQNIKVTEDEIKKKISPKSINVSINSVKAIKNGKLIVKCNTKEDVEKFIEETDKQQLNNKYNIKLSQMKKPKIKIITSIENMSQDEFEESIKNQNHFITTEDHFKITFITNKNRNGNRSILAECSGNLFKKFMTRKKVYVDWERCPVYEDLLVSKCKKCNAYDHKESNCKNKQTCPMCAEEHLLKDCPKSVNKCCNCQRSNEKYPHLNHDINHDANNHGCPTFNY